MNIRKRNKIPLVQITSLQKLYSSLQQLYEGIELICSECKDPDCMGYIWLLKEEASRLFDKGVPLVQINKGPIFIHSFLENQKGDPDLSARYPPCSQLCAESGRCNIYGIRPLVCRLYPIGLETKADMIVWALHNDCLFIRRLESQGLLTEFKSRALETINNLSPKMINKIVETYKAVDAISLFPNGENNYSILKEVCYVEM